MSSWVQKFALRFWCVFGWHTWFTTERLRGSEEGMVIQRCVGCKRMQKVKERDDES